MSCDHTDAYGSLVRDGGCMLCGWRPPKPKYSLAGRTRCRKCKREVDAVGVGRPQLLVSHHFPDPDNRHSTGFCLGSLAPVPSRDEAPR